jgi:hypothetical protein
MSTLVLTTTTKFAVITCYKCAVPFCMTEEMDTERRRSHDNFWCPNGHSQSYIHESKEETLRKKLEATELALQATKSQYNNLECTLIDTGRKLERVKKRLKGGKCPCCNRNFTALARHIATKHPAYGTKHDKGK